VAWHQSAAVLVDAIALDGDPAGHDTFRSLSMTQDNSREKSDEIRGKLPSGTLRSCMAATNADQCEE